MTNDVVMGRQRLETLAGAVVALTGLALAWGASRIPGEAGYGGVGPNFLPWVVALGLMLCGVGLVLEARRAVTRSQADVATSVSSMGEEAAAEIAPADWRSGAWMLAGLLLNAALIERVGFIIACGLCFVLAARGLRQAEGRGSSMGRTLVDALTGVAIAAPTYWMFTQVLGIALPGLTSSGWL